MGELSKLYSVADVAFIGGSFSGTGGITLLKPQYMEFQLFPDLLYLTSKTFINS